MTISLSPSKEAIHHGVDCYLQITALVSLSLVSVSWFESPGRILIPDQIPHMAGLGRRTLCQTTRLFGDKLDYFAVSGSSHIIMMPKTYTLISPSGH